MGVPRVQTEGRLLTEMSMTDVERAVRLWERRAAAARRLAAASAARGGVSLHPPLRGQLDRTAAGPTTAACRWTSASRRRTRPWLVRAKGTADHWTPLEQIWTAEKAAKSRGFWPWPNTARYCGLI